MHTQCAIGSSNGRFSWWNDLIESCRRVRGGTWRVERAGHCIAECEFLTGTRSAEGIMASGHVNRTQRSNTWLHRPSLPT